MGALGPQVPAHLDLDAEPTPLAIRQWYEDFDERRLLHNFRFQIDFYQTAGLYDGVESFAQQHGCSERHAHRMRQWCGAAILAQIAQRYLDGRATPRFIAWDGPGIVQRERDAEAVKYLLRAIEYDSEWEEPGSMLSTTEERLASQAYADARGTSILRRLAPRFGLVAQLGRNSPSPHELEVASTARLQGGVAYQFLNAVSASVSYAGELGGPPFTFEDPLGGWLGSGAESFRDHLLWGVQMQPPVRFQLGRVGLRPELSIDWGALDYSTSELTSSGASNRSYGRFRARGSFVDFGVGIVPRRQCAYEGWRKGMSLHVGYRRARLDPFRDVRTRSAWVSPFDGEYVRMNPSGPWIKFTLGYY